jgi:hypothetical protein
LDEVADAIYTNLQHSGYLMEVKEIRRRGTKAIIA